MPARLRRLLLPFLLLAGLALAQEPPPDPDTLPYKVEIAPTGDGRLDAALAAVSQLVALQDSGADQRRRRARPGRWRPGEAAAGPAIGRLLGRHARGSRWPAARWASRGCWSGWKRRAAAAAGADRGGQGPALPHRPYRPARPGAGRAAGGGSAAAATPFGLAVGDPARAEPVLAAERTLLDRLLTAGHPLASMVRRETTVDHDRKAMDVAWTFAPGPVAVFAAPDVDGMVQVDRTFLRAQAARHRGRALQPGDAGAGTPRPDGDSAPSARSAPGRRSGWTRPGGCR